MIKLANRFIFRKASNLREDLHALTNKLKTMQNRVDKATKHEELFDKTIDDLRAELNRDTIIPWR